MFAAKSVVAAALLLLQSVQADVLQEKLSFGHHEKISSDLRSVPGWHLEADSTSLPTLLSDRIILTPPWPGNRRGALWTTEKLQSAEWAVEVQFRATGGERAGGNLQIWYTKENHGTSSVYTIGKFDGLVLVLDTYGGRGGSIRGFLNDGNTDYKTHHHVDSLAFGHCDYAYRNLGRLSKLGLKQSSSALEVSIDDKPCFKTDKIQLPAEYLFGLSAASAETPDTFEAYKFIVRSSGSTSSSTAHQSSHHDPVIQGQSSSGNNNHDGISTGAWTEINTRLRELKAQLDHLQSQLTEVTSKSGESQQALSRISSSTTSQQLESMAGRITNMESSLRAIQKGIEGWDYRAHLNNLEDALRDSHSTLMTHLPLSLNHAVHAAAPRLGVFVWMILAFQLLLAASYVVYKRRRANAPKKYL